MEEDPNPEPECPPELGIGARPSGTITGLRCAPSQRASRYRQAVSDGLAEQLAY